MTVPRAIFVCVASLILGSTAAYAQHSALAGKVVDVTGGDTLIIVDAQKNRHRVRLQGIDAPDAGQEFRQRSERNLEKLLSGRQVTVEVTGTQAGGLTTGRVKLSDRDVALEQLKAGLAWYDGRDVTRLTTDEQTRYAAAERQARERRAGLWRGSRPVAPWEFRLVTSSDAVAAGTASAGPIHADKRKRRYYWPNCPDFKKVKEKDRVIFGYAEEAEQAGYKPGQNCP